MSNGIAKAKSRTTTEHGKSQPKVLKLGFRVCENRLAQWYAQNASLLQTSSFQGVWVYTTKQLKPVSFYPTHCWHGMCVTTIKVDFKQMEENMQHKMDIGVHVSKQKWSLQRGVYFT